MEPSLPSPYRIMRRSRRPNCAPNVYLGDPSPPAAVDVRPEVHPSILGEISVETYKARQDTRLVLAHEARVTDHIGGQNGGETALHGILPSAL